MAGHVAEAAVGGPQLLSFAKQRGPPVGAGAVIRLRALITNSAYEVGRVVAGLGAVNIGRRVLLEIHPAVHHV